MKALTWQARRRVEVKEVPDPRIEQPTDAIVRITSTAICGSDLHLYELMGPFLDRGDKGVVILCRTSNPGAADLQDLPIAHAGGTRPLYQHVADTIAREWNSHGNVSLVVGATWPGQLREVRAIVGDMPFLVPGVGAQGGDVEAVVTNAKTADGTGLMVSSSRAILYASNGDDYADAAAHEARTLRDAINRHR